MNCKIGKYSFNCTKWLCWKKNGVTKDLRVGIGTPFFLPKVATTLMKRQLYYICHLTQPISISFSSHHPSFSYFLATLRVLLLTFPAQARVSWTLPQSTWLATSRAVKVSTPCWPRVASIGMPARSTIWFSRVMPFSEPPRALIWVAVSWLVGYRACSSWTRTKNCMLATESTAASTAAAAKTESRNRREYILLACCVPHRYLGKHSQ